MPGLYLHVLFYAPKEYMQTEQKEGKMKTLLTLVNVYNGKIC